MGPGLPLFAIQTPFDYLHLPRDLGAFGHLLMSYSGL